MDNQKYNHYDGTNEIPRRWFPLWKLDGYILREFLIKYSILMLIFVTLFVLNDVFNDIEDFLVARADWRDIVLYLLCKLPGNIRFILPISMLLGCMWTMADFGKKLEVTAMRASGVSLFRCGAPILAAGLFMSFVNIFFNEYLIPKTENRAEEIYSRAADGRTNIRYLLAFRSSDGKRHWLFSNYVNNKEQKDVTVKTFWNDEMISMVLGSPEHEQYLKNVCRIFPSRANHLMSLGRKELTARVKTLLDNRKVDITASEVNYDAAGKVWHFKNGSFTSYDRPDELRFEASKGTSLLHSAIKFDRLSFSQKTMPETPEDIVNTVKEKDDLSSFVILDLIRRNPNMPSQVKAIYLTVFFYRLAFPWACFLSVFLGIPLATKNERTGSMLAIITAVALIVVYIITAQIFLTLGKGGVINPVIAGLAPTIVFITAGAWKILSDRN